MQSISNSKFFELFLEWVLSLNLIERENLGIALEEFGGICGVIKDELYISAYEEIGRQIAKNLSYDALCEFLESNSEKLSENSAQLYYFVEAIVDEVSVAVEDVKPLISVCPEQYRSFLIKRFS